MSLPKLTKTNYSGVSYYKDSSKGKVFVAIFEVNKKRYRKIVGYENDEFKTNAKIAYLKKEELKNDILNNNYASKNITFKQLWELYFTHLEDSKSVAKRTYETKKSYYNAHFKNVFDNLAINNIQVFQIQNFANNLLKTKSPKTVDNLLADLSSIFKFAVKNKLITSNPVRQVDKPKYDNSRDFPLTLEEKYKDFPNKDEILTNIIQELKNWKIYDYGSFIDKTLFQLKKDISNPNTSEDGKYYLLKKLPYYEDLKTNYNKVINEPKYA